jgi:hypothetical protein
MDNVATACQFTGVSARPAAGIEDRRSWQNLPVHKPGGHHGAFFLDRPVNEQIERPRVLSVERARKGLTHLDVVFAPTAAAADCKPCQDALPACWS